MLDAASSFVFTSLQSGLRACMLDAHLAAKCNVITTTATENFDQPFGGHLLHLGLLLPLAQGRSAHFRLTKGKAIGKLIVRW